MPRTHILVADPDARARLRAVAALRGRFEVQTLQAGVDVVRTVRQHRPEIVLLAMPRARMTEAIVTCRTLKTEAGDPPIVGLIDRWRRFSEPDSALEACRGDGYLGGKAGPEDVLEFASALAAGGRPISLFQPELGILGRIIRRNTIR